MDPSSPSSLLQTRPSHPTVRIPVWRILIPLVAQVLIIATIPAQKAATLATGTTVYLQTAPVDPYDLLRGRYVTLNYEIGDRTTLQDLPGGEAIDEPEFYIQLAPPTAAMDPTAPWQPVAVSIDYPRDLPADHVAIRAQGGSWRLDLGLGQYFIPDEVGDALEVDMNQYQEQTRVEAKIDDRGNAALVRLWVQDRPY
ncbi:MAG: GDYXXLXY domain-containing protein [Synechococcaceae cyanobacterium SM2_3_2]|nr:GDYXXLXY domain-containing protein [Synechococcaceae cyanobacterium SM2_3_2]